MTAYDYRILKVFINEGDRCQKEPLYDWIVRKALDDNIASATVLRGLEGVGGEKKIAHDEIAFAIY